MYWPMNGEEDDFEEAPAFVIPLMIILIEHQLDRVYRAVE